MVECPFCHVTHVINTIFCDECGQFIGESGGIVTEKFSSEEEEGQPVRWKNPRDTMKINFTDDQEGEQVQVYPVICLDIGPGKREIQVQLDRPVHIGRLDATNNVFPITLLVVYTYAPASAMTSVSAASRSPSNVAAQRARAKARWRL